MAEDGRRLSGEAESEDHLQSEEGTRPRRLSGEAESEDHLEREEGTRIATTPVRGGRVGGSPGKGGGYKYGGGC